MWPHSCFMNGHNMIVCGERELRGERRRKDGRSLLATAAPSFFVVVSLLVCARDVSAQRVQLVLRGGVAMSSTLVQERIGTPGLEQVIGAQMDDLVSAIPTPAASVGVGARVAFWPRTLLETGIEYARGGVNAKEDGGTRRIQDLGVLQAQLGVSWYARPGIELGANAALLRYDTEEQGIFAGGAGMSGAIGGRAAWTPPVLSGRIAIEANAQGHRFGTPAIQRSGGIDANVLRYGVNLRVQLAEVGR